VSGVPQQPASLLNRTYRRYSYEFLWFEKSGGMRLRMERKIRKDNRRRENPPPSIKGGSGGIPVPGSKQKTERNPLSFSGRLIFQTSAAR